MARQYKEPIKNSQILVAVAEAEENRQIVEWLKKYGISSSSVYSCEELINTASENRFPVIITDLKLQDNDPLKIPSLLNSSKKIPKSTFILVMDKQTDNQKSDILSILKKSGYEEFITRPLNREDLISRVLMCQKLNKMENTLARAVKYIQTEDKSSTDLKNISNDIIIQWGKLETLGRLTSGIIHEITTPVQYVSDNMDFLNESFKPVLQALKVLLEASDIPHKDKLRQVMEIINKSDLEYLQQEIPQAISQSINGIDKISEVLLSIRRLSRQNSLDTVKTDINKTIENSILLTQSVWKNVAEFHTDFDKKLPMVECQPGEISQVIINIIVNAAHAIEEDKTKKTHLISVKTQGTDDYVKIEIVDTGRGIPKKLLKKIFQPFFTTKKIDRGTGQGLAIVKTIIENHNGKISATSVNGKGTKFSILLPCNLKGKQSISENQNGSDLIQKNKPVEKPRILFVDDQIDALQSLKRMLKAKSEIWDMEFKSNCAQALDTVKTSRTDIVVTDYHMKEMAGFNLLKQVKEFSPQTERIILSGETDENLIMETMNVATQFIPKPVTPTRLKEILTRSCAMQNILKDKGVKNTLSKIDSLPSIPSIYDEIVKELNSSSSSTKRIGEIISKDPAMTSKILQVINSGFFYLSTKISKPTEAVILLGIDTVKALVLHIEIFSKLKLPATFKNFLGSMHSHAMETAVVAKEIAISQGLTPFKSEQCFMAALLHDCGKLVLASNFPKDYVQVINNKNKNGTTFLEEEKKIFGTGHDRVGAYLMGLWGLPLDLIEGILYHHTPSESSAREFGTIAAVHISNSVVKETESAEESPIDKRFLERLKLNSSLEDWKNLLADQ